MKSDKFSKFLISLTLGIFGAVLLLLAAESWGIVPLSKFTNFPEDGPAFLRVLLGILFVALCAGVIYVIIRALKLGKELDAGEMNLLTRSSAGESFISNEAVSELVQRILKKNKQIKSASCKVIPVEDGVNVQVRQTVYSGTDLNQLCTAVQSSIKQEIESVTGIPVRNVAVNIIKTVQGTEPVTETKRVN